MIDRRLLLALAATATAAPLGSFAQSLPTKTARLGWLVPGTRPSQEPMLEVFRQGMRELGWVEGRTFEITYVYADAHFDRLPDLAAKLVEMKVDIIVTVSTPASLAAKAATRTIPIVFAASSDPVSTGVVDGLAHPGGNITGLSQMAADLSGKRLELLENVLAGISEIAVLWDSSNPGMALRVRETKLAAEQAGIVFYDAGARDLGQLEASFATLLKRRPNALVVTTEPFTIEHRDRIIEFAMQNRLPAMYEEARFVRAGGLMSYGPSLPGMFRRAAGYVDKILKGATPADLPVEQPTQFELVINLKTAKALGLPIPQAVLAAADEVIE